jgi:hypothetical protein
MIKVSYRPSFDFIVRTNVVHIAMHGTTKTACGKDAKEFRKIYNLILEIEKIKDPAFCKQCKEAYHQRDEEKFGLVK